MQTLLLVALDARYRLFDRFEFAANYAYGDSDAPLGPTTHHAHVWFGADFPLDEHRLGFTVLERYGTSAVPSAVASAHPSTDLAVRYSLPVGNTWLTLAGDVTNALGQGEAFDVGRSMRFWVRFRI
jgi:hypothetical protein